MRHDDVPERLGARLRLYYTNCASTMLPHSSVQLEYCSIRLFCYILDIFRHIRHITNSSTVQLCTCKHALLYLLYLLYVLLIAINILIDTSFLRTFYDNFRHDM